MRGTGRTVFSGTRIEEFQVEILGVLENVGPKQSIVLARLSGGPLEKTGVLQGMSGSPVYIQGRLLGAVAMSFPFSKEPLCAIRPIEEMLRSAQGELEQSARIRFSFRDGDLTRYFGRPANFQTGPGRIVDIATPVAFSGFTRNTIEHFAPQLRALGLEPSQGISGGGRLLETSGNPAPLVPGSMISVLLLTGDMTISADGTVTYVDGQKVYAFGHRFLSIGSTEIPFARAEVLTLLPSLASSFKISAPREWAGTITQDRSTAVTGELGRRAALAPISISMTRHAASGRQQVRSNYHMEMVNDPFLSPFLVQMAVFSAIDATERTIGSSTLAIRGEIEFKDGSAPIRLNNMYAGDFSVPQQASLGTAVPLAYALQSGFQSLRLRNIKLDIDSFDERKTMQIDQVWASRRIVRPGETVQLTVSLLGSNGKELVRKVSYTIPIGMPAGTLYFTVADGNTTNMAEFRQILDSNLKSPSQLIAFLNSLRNNTNAYVRIWRQGQNYSIQGQDLPNPPPSVDQILARSQASLGGTLLSTDSKVAEMVIDSGGFVVTGSRSIQVEVKQ